MLGEKNKSINNIKGVTIWLTGLPCSGKTTIANALSKILKEEGYKKVEIIDGDIIREYISKGLGFSREDRFENIRRVSFVAKLLTRNDVITIVAVISPYREMRKMAREMIGENFVEVFVNAPLEVCEKRDVKGMYEKARKGIIKNFTGIDDPYEPPENPDIELRTDILQLEECVYKILKFLKEKGYIDLDLDLERIRKKLKGQYTKS
jgi:adenylylsulfate kinase